MKMCLDIIFRKSTWKKYLRLDKPQIVCYKYLVKEYNNQLHARYHSSYIYQKGTNIANKHGIYVFKHRLSDYIYNTRWYTTQCYKVLVNLSDIKQLGHQEYYDNVEGDTCKYLTIITKQLILPHTRKVKPYGVYEKAEHEPLYT